ncbi:HCP-like protein [Peniophora sp. CONT]|nr:HCP-like protein [Peniophora sp. CONT]
MNVPPPPPLHHNRTSYASSYANVPPPPPPQQQQQQQYQQRPPSHYSGGPGEIIVSPPHFEQPLVAPRPSRADPQQATNMAQALDSQLNQPPPSYGRGPSPAPTFQMPMPGSGGGGRISPMPPPNGTDWSPWNVTRSPSPGASLGGPMSSMSIASPSPPGHPPTPAISQDGTALTAPLPTLSSLIAGLGTGQNPAAPPHARLAWARDVLVLAERLAAPPADANTPQPGPADPPAGPIPVSDPELQRLIDVAIPLILQLASTPAAPHNPSLPPQQQPALPAYVAEALYWRAALESSGAHPTHVQQNPRAAFRDFEKAARSNFHRAWFRLGRDYEGFNDAQHARDCFERGAKRADESCLYRLGMAHLLGQLGLPPNPAQALPLLQRAATLATTSVPQPAYVFALLLLGQFAPAQIPPHMVPTPEAEARKHLERAAYLHYAPAQYKLGHAYEFAEPPFAFDPLLSVQYYSLASQQGSTDADMALSKWFLCGAEPGFEKDEGLAYTFAEKAARKGLPAAEFAMGYYAEVGVGGERNAEIARKWYERAAQHGNSDASDRLQALAASQQLSREAHAQLTQATVVRKHTQAKNRSDARPPSSDGHSQPSAQNGQQIIANVRKNSVRRPHGQGRSQQGAGAPMEPIREASVGSPAMQQGPPMQQGPSMSHGPPGGPGRGRPPQGQQQPHGRFPSPGPGPQPPNGPQRARPDAARYTLSDAPPQGPPPGQPMRVSPQGSPRMQAAQVQGPPGGRQTPQGGPGAPGGRQTPQGGQGPPGGPGRQGSASTVIPRPPPGKGPTTFQEMGISGAKLEDKECVIM